MQLRNTPERAKRAQHIQQEFSAKPNTSGSSGLSYTKIVVGIGILGYLGYELWAHMQPETQPIQMNNEYCFEKNATYCTDLASIRYNQYPYDSSFYHCIEGVYRWISDIAEKNCAPIGMTHVELSESNPQLLVELTQSSRTQFPVNYLHGLLRTGKEVFFPSEECRSDMTSSLSRLKLS